MTNDPFRKFVEGMDDDAWANWPTAPKGTKPGQPGYVAAPGSALLYQALEYDGELVYLDPVELTGLDLQCYLEAWALNGQGVLYGPPDGEEIEFIPQGSIPFRVWAACLWEFIKITARMFKKGA